MNYEEYAARARRMNPIDDDFMKKMAEDKEFCQEVIQTVLSDPSIQVLTARPQDGLKNLQGRSVVLDIHCEMTDGSHVNIEVQGAEDDDHQRRVRYNAACITVNITDPGSKFEGIPDVYMIYITKKDFLRRGSCIYHIERRIGETGEQADNGLHEIYVNAQVKDGSLVSGLMTIFTEDDAYDDEHFPATSRRKRYFKEDEEGVREMCAIMQEIREEGRIEGRFELLIQMYRDGDISLAKACRRLGCSKEEFREREKAYQIG